MKGIGRGVVASLVASAAFAHPHFNKTVTATLGENVQVTITYNTTPANEAHAQSAKVGEFVTPRRPVLKLSAELKTAKATLPAGEYTIGVIKNAEKDWTLALYPGRPAARRHARFGEGDPPRLDVLGRPRHRRPHAGGRHARARQVRRQGRADAALRVAVPGGRLVLTPGGDP